MVHPIRYNSNVTDVIDERSVQIMAYLTTRPIDELYPLSVNFFPHPLLSTIPAKCASSGQITYYILEWI